MLFMHNSVRCEGSSVATWWFDVVLSFFPFFFNLAQSIFKKLTLLLLYFDLRLLLHCVLSSSHRCPIVFLFKLYYIIPPTVNYRSGKGKGGKGGKGGKAATSKKAAQSRSSRAGLQFPVSRVHRYLKKGRFAARISAGAPVYMTAAHDGVSRRRDPRTRWQRLA